MSQSLKSVLSHYRLFTPVLKQFGKLTKVYTGTGIYALKEAELSEGNARTLQLSADQYFNSVPLVLSQSGQRVFSIKNKLYYLTPWMSERRMNQFDKAKVLLEELSQVHQKTSQLVPFQQMWKRNYTENMERSIIKTQAILERYITVAEKEVYMSPFHYLFCSHFPMWMATINQSKAFVQRWKELIKEEQQLRIVLNHGKLSPEHFLVTSKGNYFINLENVHWNMPHYDLLTLWNGEVMKDRIDEQFDVYHRGFTLKEYENYYLALHLLSLQRIAAIVTDYERGLHASELEAVRKLQQAQIAFEQKSKFVKLLLQEKEKQSHV